MTDPTKTCRECGAALAPGSPARKVFCSAPCKARWHGRSRVRDLDVRREQDRARKIERGAAVVGTLLTVPCLECREMIRFEVKPAGRYPRLCSPKCKQRRRRRQELQQKYGITLEQYEERYAQQGGRCAICAGPLLTRKMDHFAHVDHCHKSAAVRGLLCFRCNLAIGQFGDDLDRLRAAIQYLERC